MMTTMAAECSRVNFTLFFFFFFFFSIDKARAEACMMPNIMYCNPGNFSKLINLVN